ncbi:hypothetical protein RSAG8_09428, partial [Rhizoctonia solani AG-8 WAC10335]
MSHPPSSNHAPSPSHTNIHSPSHTALHSPIHTTAHSRAHSPTRGILASGMSNDFMNSLLGSTNGLLGMNDEVLLGMDNDALMANAFAAGADTQMFDPGATDPTSPAEWEAMLQELTNQPLAAVPKQPCQGAMYVEHPQWGSSSNWEPPAPTSVPWPPESIDLASPETTPIPRVSRVVPNSGPVQGGIEVTLLGENFTRAYECKFGDYVATETALWGGNTLVCLLPPAAQAGAVSVRIKGYESVPLRPGEREVLFTYKDDMLDRNLMELALRVVGQRMTGRQEEPCNIARRIVAVGEMQNNSNMLVTRLAQSVIESDAPEQQGDTGPTRQEELIQFLTLLDVPNVGTRGVSTSSAVSLQNEIVQVMSHPPSSNHAPSPSHTNIHSPSHTALHSPIHTTAHSRAHSPTRGILTNGISNDFMNSLLGSTNGLLGMNDEVLLGMDNDALMANAFAAGADTQMFDPGATDPTSPAEWEAMLQELTNQPLAAAPKQPCQGAMYVEHPQWGSSSNWEPPAPTSVPWPPESIDLASPETTPIPRVSRVVPNSGPVQGGIEVTLLGENFTRAYECKFGDYVATETALWGGNTLVCLLPPAAQAGAVSVRIKGYESVPLRPGEREVLFTYKDDMLDRNLMELALRVVGQRMTGRQEEPCNIARRIVAVGEMQNNSNMLVTRLAQSVIESDATEQQDGTGPTRQEELMFLTLLDVPNVGTRGVSTSSAVSLQNETGHTLLHLCAVVGFDALATDLISRGADPDVRDATGQTPLHLAALRGHAACARVLLLAGADTEIVNAYGMAPVDVAREHARSEVLALLEGADEESEAEEEEEAELRAPSLDESTGAEADESDLDADDERQSRASAEASSEEDGASDDLFADDTSRPSLDSVIDGRPPFLGDMPKVPSTWFHRTFSHLQPQKAWPLSQINLPDIPALAAWPVTIPWPQTPDGGSFDLGTIRGFLGSKQQQPNAAGLTVYPPPPQPGADAQPNLNQVQLRARLARRLGYYPTEVTDGEIRAYTHHSQKMGKLKKDRMLVLFWLPILLIVIAWGLYQSIPVAFKAMASTIRGYLPLPT